MLQNNRSMLAAKILQFLHKNSYFLYKIIKTTMKRINFKTYVFKMSRVDINNSLAKLFFLVQILVIIFKIKSDQLYQNAPNCTFFPIFFG